jgi:hypothetical protein
MDSASKLAHLQGSIRGGITTKKRGVGIFAISPERRKAISSSVGKKTQAERTGIFSLSRKQKVKWRKAITTLVERSRRERIGLFSQTAEQLSKNGRKAITFIPRETKVRNGKNFPKELRTRNGYLSTHRQWHEARGRISPKCPFCTGEME